MRIDPLVGTKVWFAPRRDGLGIGWRPVSWEGWLVVLATIGAVLGATTLPEGSLQVSCILSGVAVLVVACVLKGTSPGGRPAAAEYDRLSRDPGLARMERDLQDAHELSLRDVAESFDRRTKREHPDAPSA